MNHAEFIDFVFKAMKEGKCPYKIALFRPTNRYVLDLGNGTFLGDITPQ